MQLALVGQEPHRAVRHPGDVQPDVHRRVRGHRQLLADPGLPAVPGRRELQPDSRRFGQPAAAGPQSVEDVVAGEVLGEHHGVRRADHLRGAVRVAVADRGQPGAPVAQRHRELGVPAVHGRLVVVRPGAVPHLDGVGVLVPELPLAGDVRAERVGRDHQAALPLHLAGEPGEGLVAGAVAPVDELARAQAQREPVAVARGDLLAGQDQQVGAGQRAPDAVGGGGVVVGGHDEVQPGRARPGGHLGGLAAPVGVHGVQVAVAPVPGPAAPPGALRRVGGGERAAGRAEPQGDVDPVLQSLRSDLVRAEDDVPAARADRPRQVARGGPLPAHRELGPEAARPAAEAPAAEFGAALVEQPDVAGVARGAGRHGRPVVPVGDGEFADAGRDVEGQVHEVGCAGRQLPGQGDRPVLGCGRGGGPLGPFGPGGAGARHHRAERARRARGQ